MNKFLFLFTLFISSCTITPNDSSKGSLSGRWHFINLNGAYCNVCPSMELMEGNKGVIAKPSKEKIEFNYRLDKNRIGIYFTETKKFFGNDSEFYFRFYFDENLQYLELKSINGNGNYMLSKEDKE